MLVVVVDSGCCNRVSFCFFIRAAGSSAESSFNPRKLEFGSYEVLSSWFDVKQKCSLYYYYCDDDHFASHFSLCSISTT